ncbi:MAG: HD domain-containing protein [Candidatus Thorarchaeota archaeon]
MDGNDDSYLATLLDETPVCQIHHGAIGHAMNGDALPTYSSKDLKEMYPHLFEDLAIVERESLGIQRERWDTARNYPAHLVWGHGNAVRNNSLLLSLLGKVEPTGADVRNALVASAAGLLHDLGKGETDGDGQDMHAKWAADVTKDRILPHLERLYSDEMDKIVYVIEKHEDVRRDLCKGGVFNWAREHFGSSNKHDPAYVVSLADTLDRAKYWRMSVVLYQASKESGIDPDDFMRDKWFFSHDEDGDIYEPVDGDKRPQVLRVFDDDVRAGLNRFKARMDVGDHTLAASVRRVRDFILEMNRSYRNITPEELERAYDLHACDMSRYFRSIE